MLAQSFWLTTVMKGYAREKMREITADRSALRKCRNAVSAGVLSPISSAVGRNGAVGDKRNARAGGRCPGGEQVLRLRARDGAFRAPARVTFFCCQKKVTKENRLKLRFKTSLARGGQVQIWRCWLRGIGAAGVVVGSGDCLYLLRRCR